MRASRHGHYIFVSLQSSTCDQINVNCFFFLFSYPGRNPDHTAWWTLGIIITVGPYLRARYKTIIVIASKKNTYEYYTIFARSMRAYRTHKYRQYDFQTNVFYVCVWISAEKDNQKSTRRPKKPVYLDWWAVFLTIDEREKKKKKKFDYLHSRKKNSIPRSLTRSLHRKFVRHSAPHLRRTV